MASRHRLAIFYFGVVVVALGAGLLVGIGIIALNSLFVGITSISTVALVLVTVKNVYLVREQLESSRKQFESQYNPRLVLDVFWNKERTHPFLIWVRNDGNSPATSVCLMTSKGREPRTHRIAGQLASTDYVALRPWLSAEQTELKMREPVEFEVSYCNLLGKPQETVVFQEDSQGHGRLDRGPSPPNGHREPVISFTWPDIRRE